MFIVGIVVLSSLVSSGPANLRGEICQTGMESFARNFHPLLRERCSDCHGDDSSLVMHSQTDPAKAYEAAMTVVRFPDFEESTLVAKVEKKHWLRYDAQAKGMTKEEALEALKAWWDEGQMLCPLQGKIVTEEIRIPAKLPQYNVEPAIELNFSLASLGAPGASIKVGIQNFSEKSEKTPGSYILKHPRLILGDKAIHMKGLRPSVSGKIDPLESSYAMVDVQAKAAMNDGTSDPVVTLSTESLIVTRRGESGSLALSFDLFEIKDCGDCGNLEEFQTRVWPAIQAAECANCHQNGKAVPSFQMSENADVLCSQMANRINRKFPESSVLFSYTEKGFKGHPMQWDRQTVFEIIRWIESESR